MPYSSKSFLEIDESIIDVLLVLQIFFAQNSNIEDLFSGTCSCPEVSLYLGDDVFC